MAYILALVVGLGSVGLYMAAFFFPEVYRKNDFVLSGIGMFYALVLWVCAGRMTGGVLLGQMASVTLLGWLAWQSLEMRRSLTPIDQQTRLPGSARTLGDVLQKLAQELPGQLQQQVKQMSLPAALGGLSKRATRAIGATPARFASRGQNRTPKQLQDGDRPRQPTAKPPSDQSTKPAKPARKRPVKQVEPPPPVEPPTADAIAPSSEETELSEAIELSEGIELSESIEAIAAPALDSVTPPDLPTEPEALPDTTRQPNTPDPLPDASLVPAVALESPTPSSDDFDDFDVNDDITPTRTTAAELRELRVQSAAARRPNWFTTLKLRLQRGRNASQRSPQSSSSDQLVPAPEMIPEITPAADEWDLGWTQELAAAELAADTLTDVEPEVEPDALLDVEPDALLDVEPDALLDVEPDALLGVEPEVEPDTLLDVEPDALLDVEPEVEPDALPEVEPEVEPDALPDVEPEVEPEVEPDALPEFVADMPSESLPKSLTDFAADFAAEPTVDFANEPEFKLEVDLNSLDPNSSDLNSSDPNSLDPNPDFDAASAEAEWENWEEPTADQPATALPLLIEAEIDPLTEVSNWPDPDWPDPDAIAFPTEDFSELLSTPPEPEPIEYPEEIAVLEQDEAIGFAISQRIAPPPDSNEPPSVADEPPSVIDESPTVINEPLSLIDEPLSLIDEPLSLIDEPLSLIDEPPSVVDESLSVIDEPPSVVDESLSVIDEPLSLIDKSLNVVDESLSVIDQSLSVVDESLKGELEPTDANDDSSTPPPTPPAGRGLTIQIVKLEASEATSEPPPEPAPETEKPPHYE